VRLLDNDKRVLQLAKVIANYLFLHPPVLYPPHSTIIPHVAICIDYYTESPVRSCLINGQHAQAVALLHLLLLHKWRSGNACICISFEQAAGKVCWQEQLISWR